MFHVVKRQIAYFYSKYSTNSSHNYTSKRYGHLNAAFRVANGDISLFAVSNLFACVLAHSHSQKCQTNPSIFENGFFLYNYISSRTSILR